MLRHTLTAEAADRFAAVTLGGLGSAFGALVGSIVLGVFMNLATLVIPENLKYAAALVVLIVILLFRPTGILGESLGKARV